MSTSNPLRGTRRLRPTTSWPSAGRPKRRPRRRPGARRRAGGSARRRRRAGSMTVGQRRPCRRARSPRPPDSRRRRHHQRGAAQHLRQQPAALPGSRPGTVDLGAVDDHPVGPLERRARSARGAGPDRARRASAPSVGGQPVGSAPTRPGCGSRHAGARRARSRKRLRPRPTRRRCGWAVVSTTTSSAGRRRHSSQR